MNPNLEARLDELALHSQVVRNAYEMNGQKWTDEVIFMALQSVIEKEDLRWHQLMATWKRLCKTCRYDFQEIMTKGPDIFNDISFVKK